MQPQAFERSAREEQRGEAAKRKPDGAGVEPAITPGDRQGAKGDQPIGGKAEEIEQHVGEPGADRATGVARQRLADAMRPGRIVAVIGDEDEQQVQGERPEEEPFCFAYQAREPGGQRRGAALSHYGQGYSGSMIVSRSTMLEPRISM